MAIIGKIPYFQTNPHGDPMSSVVIHGFAYQEAIDVWFRDQLLAVLGGDAATVLDSDLPVRHANGWGGSGMIGIDRD